MKQVPVVQWVEIGVRFVDIGGIDDHNNLSFLFINQYCFNNSFCSMTHIK
jgi:hypothetical protein